MCNDVSMTRVTGDGITQAIAIIGCFFFRLLIVLRTSSGVIGNVKKYIALNGKTR